MTDDNHTHQQWSCKQMRNSSVFLQAECEKLRAEVARSQTEARQLQQRCSEQLAAAEREAAARGAKADAALRAAREEHSRGVARLLEERQAALDAAHKKMLESEVSAPPLPTPVPPSHRQPLFSLHSTHQNDTAPN